MQTSRRVECAGARQLSVRRAGASSQFTLSDAPVGLQIDLVQGMVECLYAQCTPCITDCVMAELEKLGQKFRVALKIAKDPRIRRLPCSHTGTYADDCICDRVTKHRCYIVATCDKDLRRRLRKVCSCQEFCEQLFRALHCYKTAPLVVLQQCLSSASLVTMLGVL